MKNAWLSKRWGVVLLHAAAWIVLFLLPYLLRPSYEDGPPRQNGDQHTRPDVFFTLIMNATWIIFFYCNALLLIPRLVFRKRYWQYGVIQLVILVLLVAEAAMLFGIFTHSERPPGFRMHFQFTFFVYLFILATSTAYVFVVHKMQADQLLHEKENENLKTELSLLRSQVNPHFMFNVLNNMVSLARKKSDLLEPSLLRLSSLMRYMLYDTDEGKVSLEKELDYLNSYIELQRQRFGSKVQVNVHLEPVEGYHQIEPMLLIPFIENAFKHGTGMVEDAQIDIRLEVKENQLHFMVHNHYNPASADTKDKTPGIGLNNVKRRLSLLYGNRHNLQITSDNRTFIVSLKIPLH